jgi:type I restriction enzyme R subunit
LPEHNVVVREAASDLDVVRRDAFWQHLSARDLGLLRSTIAPVMRARSGQEFKSLRFEQDVLELGTALLTGQQEVADALMDSIVTQVAELPLTVNVVAKERDLIETVQKAAWWTGVTDHALIDMSRRLAPLMKYRQERRDPIMTLELADARALKETVEFGPQHERLSTAAYRERVEAAVRTLVAQNPVLQKIQRGEDVDEAELEELAVFLRDHDPHVTEELLQKIYENRAVSFLQLVRHVLGLEQVESWSTTVSRRFDEFVAQHPTLTTLQLRFVQTLRTFILQTRHLEKRHLVEQPFTQIHPKGIRGVFKEEEIEEILGFAGELIA